MVDKCISCGNSDVKVLCTISHMCYECRKEFDSWEERARYVRDLIALEDM